MKLPRDTSKFYPSREEQVEVLFRKNDKNILDLKNRFLTEIVDLSNRDLKGRISRFLYEEMYIFHRIKILRTAEAREQLAVALYHCVRPQPELAMCMFFPVDNKRISQELKYSNILYAGNLAPD